jgi:hypothetical protein
VRPWVGETCFNARAVDTSMYGMRLVDVADDAGLHVGMRCRLEVTTDDGMFICTAEVRNVSAVGVGVATTEPCPLT